ncbi:preprotein translocase subunit SecY, partial [Rhodococcus jostii]
VLPHFFLSANQSTSSIFGGAAVLILVSVALDTVKQIESQLMQRNYEGFLK